MVDLMDTTEEELFSFTVAIKCEVQRNFPEALKLSQNKHVQPNIFKVYYLVHLVYISPLIRLFTTLFSSHRSELLVIIKT